jgi:hypothetical protein
VAFPLAATSTGSPGRGSAWRHGRVWTPAALAIAVAFTLGVTACGGGSTTNTSTSSSTTAASSGGGTSSGGGQSSGGGGLAIGSFSAPSQVSCTTSTSIHLAWTTKGATSVTISIDGPGIYATYAANGSASVPFACDGKSHTYLLTAKGPNGSVTSTRTVSKANGGSTTSTTKK